MGSMMGLTQRAATSPQRWSGVTIDATARYSDKPNKPTMRVKTTNPE